MGEICIKIDDGSVRLHIKKYWGQSFKANNEALGKLDSEDCSRVMLLISTKLLTSRPGHSLTATNHVTKDILK